MQDGELARGLIEAVAQPVIADCLRRGLNDGPDQLAVDLGSRGADVAPPLPLFCAAPRSTTRGVAMLRVAVIEGRAFTTVDGPLERPIRGDVSPSRYAWGARR